ncbi:MAG TPA: hypothetical protein VFO85_00905, partial [Vicinamibacteria bacterium]|nr:hypothetical protein [Vicinamibacteria bacterium]
MKAAYRTRAEFPLEEPARAALLAAGLLGRGGAPPRVAFAPGFLRPNSGMLDGHATFTGWVGLWPARVWAYLHEMQGLAILESQNSATPDRIGGYPFPYDTMNLVLGVDPATAGLKWNPHPDPRAFVTDTAVPVPHWRAALARLRGGHDARIALVEGVHAPATAAAAPQVSPARIVRFAAERIELEADTARPGWLILGEAWYPGWRAEVNGTEAACVPANVWMRAVPVPAGPSRITLRFRSRLLLPGAAVSLAAAALLAGCLRRRRLPT